MDKNIGLGLLAPQTCVVCGKDRPKDNEEGSAWRGLLGAMPLGSHICSDDCYNKARQRIAIHGRADKPTEDEAPKDAGSSDEETEAEKASTEPPPADNQEG
jgi:predicted nucleic acid-binding Zn ribbon protein